MQELWLKERLSDSAREDDSHVEPSAISLANTSCIN